MNYNRFIPTHWSVGSQLTAFAFALVGAILTALVLTITLTTSAILESRAVGSVVNELRSVVNMVDVFHRGASHQVDSYGRIFAAAFDGEFALVPEATVEIDGQAVPELKSGAMTLNLDFAVPDAFTRQTGGNATVFVASGADFVRVSTSVKKENGERDVGSVLDQASPAYAALRAGKTYAGLATVSGKAAMVRYEPLRDAAGNVIGALYVDIDIAGELANLKEKISAIKIGDTGYFYVMNGAPGKGLGDVLIHPTQEGTNLLGVRDANGREFMRTMLDNKNGVFEYEWKNPGERAPRAKVSAYATFEGWNWVIAGGTYMDEITTEATDLRNRIILFGLAALALFAALLYALVRATVTRPLAQARDAALQIAKGDLTVNIHSGRRDEIGLLVEAMNGISRNLSAVVGQVREGAEQIATASEQISSGNLDLCTRTERQAAGLADTASSMDQLTATVRQNADNARQANQLALTASAVAEKGGTMVSQVIDTMDSINQSSRKISDIIGVIDSIAFQTNILALNAAVEAARAGDQGRGFAVVASEVRSLAQRSAEAAKEIKTLITASSDQVDVGSKLVQEAGATMNEVLDSVARVTTIMAEISAASAEQSSGIEHVNQSIGAMDQSTQQNAALVEEASAAATAMQEQAINLARAVRLFKLDQEQEHASARPPAPAPARLAIGQD